MSAFIINFQSPKELDDLVDRFQTDGLTNIDHILNFEDTLKEWTVDKNSKAGDKVFFMCAKTSKDHMRRVFLDAKEYANDVIIAYAEKELNLYQRYAGNVVATGTLAEDPFMADSSGYNYPAWRNPWYAKIDNFQLLENPVSIDDFRDFIKVSRTGSITKLSEDQEAKLHNLCYPND